MPGVILVVAPATAATAGIPIERATMAVWLNAPPCSVTNATTPEWANSSASEGISSAATTTVPEGTARLRVQISAAHEKEHLDQLIASLRQRITWNKRQPADRATPSVQGTMAPDELSQRRRGLANRGPGGRFPA